MQRDILGSPFTSILHISHSAFSAFTSLIFCVPQGCHAAGKGHGSLFTSKRPWHFHCQCAVEINLSNVAPVILQFECCVVDTPAQALTFITSYSCWFFLKQRGWVLAAGLQNICRGQRIVFDGFTSRKTDTSSCTSIESWHLLTSHKSHGHVQ